MKLQPCKSYRAPAYPTQETLQQEPEWLRTVPRRWRGKHAVLTALAGALALMNQSCGTPDPYGNHNMGKLPGRTLITVPTEGETLASPVTQTKARPTPSRDWAPICGMIATPRSAIPEDEAKAAADQAAKPQQPSHP